jgi:hypothetical protein
MRAEKIKSNIPIKGNFVFKTEETDFPIFRILKILVYPKDNMSSPKEVIFENVAVIWEQKKFRFIYFETEFFIDFCLSKFYLSLVDYEILFKLISHFLPLSRLHHFFRL